MTDLFNNALVPDWLDAETWEDFIAHRKGIKKPMTDVAKKRLMRKLARLMGEGHDPNQLLDRSIINGWQDVWPDESAGHSAADLIEQHINGGARLPTAAELRQVAQRARRVERVKG